MAAQGALSELFRDLFALRRREPGDDLISRLVAQEGQAIRPEELAPTAQLLLLIAGVRDHGEPRRQRDAALLADRDQWGLLRSDTGLAEAAVEETLRYDPPVQRTARVAHEDLEIGGVSVQADQWVLALIGGANRDPEVYHRPADFDLTRRTPVEHLAFSGGIHCCLGALGG
jgi:cytochrome P450